MTPLAIATLFPLDTVAAGDEANGPALLRRARQRGVDAILTTVNRPEAMPDASIYLLGGEGAGGVADLVAHLRVAGFADRVRDGGAVVFAVDAGLAALARSWTGQGGRGHGGLGLLPVDVRVDRAPARTVVTRPAPRLGLPAMVGWQSGRCTLTDDPAVQSLLDVRGTGDGPAMPDGALAEGIVATTLHGPVLALNPELADLVLGRALGVPAWEPLPVPAVDLARDRRSAEVAAVGSPRRRRLARRR
jgi:hypothetical protein